MQGEYIMGGCVGGYKKDKTHQELPTGKKMKRLDLQFMQDEYSMGRWVGEWMDIVFMCIYLEASLDKINTRRRHRTRTCRAKQRPTNQVVGVNPYTIYPFQYLCTHATGTG